MARSRAACLAVLALVSRGAALLNPQQSPQQTPQQTTEVDEESRNCTCHNWKETYASGEVLCGKGKELFQPKGGAGTTPMYNLDNEQARHTLCDQFYKLLDSNECVNLGPGEDSQWCYVDSTCGKFNGGGKLVSSPAQAWKICTEKDASFRDYTPEDLLKYSQAKNIWFGGLQKMSYVGVKAGEGNLVDLNIFDNLPKDLKWPTWMVEYMSKHGTDKNGNQKPVFFDTNEHGLLPVLLVQGPKVYKVDVTDEPDYAEPGTWGNITCIAGC